MISFLNQKNIFNILLLIWVVSIPFKNVLYQGSTIFLIIFFIVYIFKNKDYDNLRILFYKYKDLFIAFSLIILSMTISNILNDVSKTEAWHLEFSYIYRYAFIFIIFIFSTLFSYSRATWVSIFICFILYLILNYKQINIKHIMGLSIVFVLLSGIFSNIDWLQNRFQQLLMGDTSQRNTIWISAIDLIKQKLFFGWGIDTWGIYGLKEFAGIHNISSKILFYMFFFGLVSFIIFLGLIIKEIFNIKNYKVLIFIVVMLIIGQLDHSIITGKTYLATMTILMFFVFMNRIDKKEIIK